MRNLRNITLVLLATLLCGCGKPAQSATPEKIPERIISLAPNITETIYALGLGDRLVGNTPYCTYPEAARAIQKVGGFGSFSYEAIVSLNPDLVILHTEYDAEKARLKSLNIPTLETGSTFIADILETIQRIGESCGAEKQANELTAQLEDRIAEIASRTAGGSPARPRVLLTFGSGETGTIQAFGPKCIHNELLEIAGGKNVVESNLPFATLSHEALLRLNPDIIIVLAPELNNAEDTSNPWEKLTAISAIKNNRVHILTDDYTCIPGPRFIQTLDDFAEIIRQNDLEAE